MKKNVFHNTKFLENKFSQDQAFTQSIVNSKNVNINTLLNRVKTNEKNKKKEKIFFLGISILTVAVMAIFIYFTNTL